MFMRRLLPLLLGLTLAGCTASADVAGTTDIQVVLFGDAEEVAGYSQLVSEFTAANPDVTVSLAPVATQDDLMAKLTTSFAGGQPPDVFLINYRFFGQFAAQGAIEEAQPYLDASASLDEASFYDAPLEAFRFDGENLACMPQNLSSLVVYYNVDLFDAAGLDRPQAGWNWDDFLHAAQTLTEGDVYGLGFEPRIIRLAPFVWSRGGELVDDDGRPTVLTVEEGPAREALDWFLDLSLEHRVVPPDREELSEDSEARFMRGRLGMYLQSRVVVPTLRNIDGFTWDVAPLPTAPDGVPASILHTDAYCMAAGSNHHDEAWRLIEFAMGPRGQEILALSGRTVPSRRDVATSDMFLEPDHPPASSHVFLDAADHLRRTPRTASWARVEKEAYSALTELFYGRVDREQGIRDLVESTRGLFELEVGP
jgi:multiple sugar transport system substrate-binding protein